MRFPPDGDYELIAEADAVPIDIRACDQEGPIHFRFRTTLGGEPLRFDVRVDEPTYSAGYD